jgi:hypothetical protein
LLRYRAPAMAEFWRALRTLKALQAEQAAALEMSAGRHAAAERTAPTPPARIAPRPLPEHAASRAHPSQPVPQAQPDEPERAAARPLAYRPSEPGTGGRTLHESAVPWLPKGPAPVFLSDAEPDPNTARPEGERKRPDLSAYRAPNEPEADGAMKAHGR